MRTNLTRRGIVGGLATLSAWSLLPRLASAAGARDPRLVVIVLRGALDGLTAVMPVGDPDFAGLGERVRADTDGTPQPLDGFFSFYGKAPNFVALYRAQELAIIHAVATTHRERSHFEAQDLLESGYARLSGLPQSGWLNRMLETMPAAAPARARPALAVAATTPIIMQGNIPVETWQPQRFDMADDDTIFRVAALYGERDPGMRQALLNGRDVDLAAMASGLGEGGTRGAAGLGPIPEFHEAARSCANLMREADGPRVTCLSFVGWDTHGGQMVRLAKTLVALDYAMGALKEGLGPLWSETAVVVVTEFGRTARFNASKGTDHGTGTVAFVAGGALAGSKIIADWPGLAPAQLYEGRDLKPTRDMRSIFKGVLTDHMGLDRRQLDQVVFPDSDDVAPLGGLFRA